MRLEALRIIGMEKPSWFDPKITIGNVLVLMSLLAGGIYTISELRANDTVTSGSIKEHERRISKLEEARDIILEVRSDVKALRAEISRRP